MSVGSGSHGAAKIFGQVVKEYLEAYPDLQKRTIARKLHHDHPELFTSVEQARGSVRKYTGCSGENNRITMRKSVKKYGRPKGKAGESIFIPEGYADDFRPFKIPKTVSKLLVLSDIHVPFHHKKAAETALDHGKSEGVDGILLNGDFLDMFNASSHEKDPRLVDFQEEIEMGIVVLRAIRARFPEIPIYFKEGNHEYRLTRYLSRAAPILLGTAECRLENLLKLHEMDIKWIGNKVPIQAGKLTILHGDEYRGGGGVNVGRWLQLKANTNAMCGHFHRTGSHIWRDLEDQTHGTWAVGCLCDLKPQYMPQNQWNHGFAIVTINKGGTFEVDNKIIINGQVRG